MKLPKAATQTSIMCGVWSHARVQDHQAHVEDHVRVAVHGGVEEGAELGLAPAQPRHPPVEHVEDARRPAPPARPRAAAPASVVLAPREGEAGAGHAVEGQPGDGEDVGADVGDRPDEAVDGRAKASPIRSVSMCGADRIYLGQRFRGPEPFYNDRMGLTEKLETLPDAARRVPVQGRGGERPLRGQGPRAARPRAVVLPGRPARRPPARGPGGRRSPTSTSWSPTPRWRPWPSRTTSSSATARASTSCCATTRTIPT